MVATNNRGHAEIVNHEVNGFLVDIDDCEAMTAYVLRLHENAEVRDIIAKQAQRDIKKYGTDAAINELVEMIVSHA